MKILVTGAAGFIGFFLVRRLLERGDVVVGLDCINHYYDVCIKYGRLTCSGIAQEKIVYNTLIQSVQYPKYRFIQLKLEDRENLKRLFEDEKFDKVCNLAAQAGVRYSLVNPHAYVESNLVGFVNILEMCRHYGIKHCIYASSSSVYGYNANFPSRTSDSVDFPISFYAATKKSNELMAHAYSYLFDLPTTGLRFFSAYGPWGRPDMALFLFTKAILEGRAIDVFNHGEMLRDFTYIEDLIECVVRVIDYGCSVESTPLEIPYKIYNIGSGNPIRLKDFIAVIENTLGMKAQKNLLPLQKGDVLETYADIEAFVRDFGYQPNTSIQEGVCEFIAWYRRFFGI